MGYKSQVIMVFSDKVIQPDGPWQGLPEPIKHEIKDGANCYYDPETGCLLLEWDSVKWYHEYDSVKNMKVFYGWHTAGANYGAYVFASDGKNRMQWFQTNHDYSGPCIVVNPGGTVDQKEYAAARRYWRILRRAQLLLKTEEPDYDVLRVIGAPGSYPGDHDFYKENEE